MTILLNTDLYSQTIHFSLFAYLFYLISFINSAVIVTNWSAAFVSISSMLRYCLSYYELIFPLLFKLLSINCSLFLLHSFAMRKVVYFGGSFELISKVFVQIFSIAAVQLTMTTVSNWAYFVFEYHVLQLYLFHSGFFELLLFAIGYWEGPRLLAVPWGVVVDAFGCGGEGWELSRGVVLHDNKMQKGYISSRKLDHIKMGQLSRRKTILHLEVVPIPIERSSLVGKRCHRHTLKPPLSPVIYPPDHYGSAKPRKYDKEGQINIRMTQNRQLESLYSLYVYSPC